MTAWIVALPGVLVLLTAMLSTGGPLYVPVVPVSSMTTPAAALHTSPAEWQTPPCRSRLTVPACSLSSAVPSQVIRTTPGSLPLRPPLQSLLPPAAAEVVGWLGT